jgi:NADPH:quinone reductase-like Zn-dependent oxidoreductase
VLVHGAAGAVGQALLSLGRLAGLELWGTARGAHAALIRELGATPIDYQREDFTRVLPGGFDVVFDGIARLGQVHTRQVQRWIGRSRVCHNAREALGSIMLVIRGRLGSRHEWANTDHGRNFVERGGAASTSNASAREWRSTARGLIEQAFAKICRLSSFYYL